MTVARVATVGFGVRAEPADRPKLGEHCFRVHIPSGRGGVVTVVEDFGLREQPGGCFEMLRVEIPRDVWNGIAEPARQDFNLRLRMEHLRPGRWSSGADVPVERLLGQELCVLAWAAEHAAKAPDQVTVIARRWAALRPEERWWLFAVTSAEAGQADDRERGWRRALHQALSDDRGPSGPPGSAIRRAPRSDASTTLPLFQEGSMA